jgi:hypothetical protein
MPEPSRGVLVAVKLVHVGHRQLSVSGLITYLRQVTAARYLQQFSLPAGGVRLGTGDLAVQLPLRVSPRA